MLDWNDLRYFLAVARNGSTLAAAKRLKVSQATVSRRIGVLEQSIGLDLFVRQPSGYSLTLHGTSLVETAESVESAVQAFTDRSAAESRRVSGTVRLTTVEAAANDWVIPALPQLRTLYPDVKVEVVCSNESLDLIRGEADLAIRFGKKPTEENLIIRRLIELEECIYASHEMITRIGKPANFAGLSRFPIVMFENDRIGYFSTWLEANVPGYHIAHSAGSLSGVTASVRAGLGVSCLPCVTGDREEQLVRLFPPIADLATPVWLVTTDSARKQPHVRAVIDFIVNMVQLRFEQETRRPVRRAA
jgi:DNA-binding transcriptional LysR family regulator